MRYGQTGSRLLGAVLFALVVPAASLFGWEKYDKANSCVEFEDEWNEKKQLWIMKVTNTCSFTITFFWCFDEPPYYLTDKYVCGNNPAPWQPMFTHRRKMESGSSFSVNDNKYKDGSEYVHWWYGACVGIISDAEIKSNWVEKSSHCEHHTVRG